MSGTGLNHGIITVNKRGKRKNLLSLSLESSEGESSNKEVNKEAPNSSAGDKMLIL